MNLNELKKQAEEEFDENWRGDLGHVEADAIAHYWLSQMEKVAKTMGEEVKLEEKSDPKIDNPKYNHLDIFGYNVAVSDLSNKLNNFLGEK
jgi:hypothetical protein